MHTSLKGRFNWVDTLKALSILGIIFNHLVESTSSPWFEKSMIGEIGNQIIIFFSFIGDQCPGIFFALSGYTLTLSFLKNRVSLKEFYLKRLLRIYPFYIGMNLFFILAKLILIGKSDIIADPRLFLSILGLRFHPELFYYLNPSWWFINTLMQFYLIFPLLFWLFSKFNRWFLLIASIIITFSARYIGLINIHSVYDSYVYLAGTTFITRLSEFVLGIVLANLLPIKKIRIHSLFYIFGGLCLSLLLYIFRSNQIGIVIMPFASTIVLSFVFYGFYLIVNKRDLKMQQILQFIAVSSFAIFIFHQPVLIYANKYLNPHNSLILAIIYAAFTIPLSIIAEKIYYKVLTFPLLKNKHIISSFAFSILIMVILIDFMKFENSLAIGLIYYLLLISILLILRYFFDKNNEIPHYLFSIYISIVIAALLYLFIAPNVNILIICLMNIFVSYILHYLVKKKIRLIVVSLIITLFIVFCTESYLINFKPLEQDTWGESPILTKHPSCVYALKRNIKKHLRYNNYDYDISTNSLGLVYPEITKSMFREHDFRILALGDAFTMPEGVSYHESYTYLLEQKLNASQKSKNVFVINGGVTGYQPDNSLPELCDLIDTLKPNLVLYEFFVNEYQTEYFNRDRLGEFYQSLGLDPIYPDSTLWLKILKFFNFRLQIKSHIGKIKNNILCKYSSRISSYSYSKSFMQFYEIENNPLYSKESLANLKKVISQMKLVCEKNKSDLVILYVPGAIEVTNPKFMAYFPLKFDVSNYNFQLPWQHLESMCKELNINLLNSSKILRSTENEGFYFSESIHWNKRGHEEVAKFLNDSILKYYLK